MSIGYYIWCSLKRWGRSDKVLSRLRTICSFCVKCFIMVIWSNSNKLKQIKLNWVFAIFGRLLHCKRVASMPIFIWQYLSLLKHKSSIFGNPCSLYWRITCRDVVGPDSCRCRCMTTCILQVHDSWTISVVVNAGRRYIDLNPTSHLDIISSILLYNFSTCAMFVFKHNSIASAKRNS